MDHIFCSYCIVFIDYGSSDTAENLHGTTLYIVVIPYIQVHRGGQAFNHKIYDISRWLSVKNTLSFVLLFV